jgi:hypothetical protein
MKLKQFQVSILLLFVLGLTGLKAQDCRNMMLTSRMYSETVDIQNVIRHEFGDNYTIADWEDLKAIPNINAWISCMGLQKEQSFMVTRNGKFIYQGKRQYNVQYFPSGKVPANFLIHDKIGNKLFLGSWYGVKWNILAIRTERHGNRALRNEETRKDYRNEEIRKDNRRNDEVGFGFLKITANSFGEKQNLKEAVRHEFDGKCEIADWSDLKALPNIDEWISRVNLQRGQTFFVTRNGELTLGRTRQYFVLYSPSGRLPGGFAAHDQIRNKLFLGSWFGERRQILVKDFRHH